MMKRRAGASLVIVGAGAVGFPFSRGQWLMLKLAISLGSTRAPRVCEASPAGLTNLRGGVITNSCHHGEYETRIA